MAKSVCDFLRVKSIEFRFNDRLSRRRAERALKAATLSSSDLV